MSHKDPRRRVRDIGDARAEFDLPTPDRPNDVDSRRQPASDADAGLESAVRIQPAIVPAWRTMRRCMWPVAAVVCAALVVTSLRLTRPDTVPSEIPSQFTLTLEEQMGGCPAGRVPGAISRWAARGLFGGSAGVPPSLWVRALDSVRSIPLEGTEGSRGPVWSPDSRWIAFYVDGKVKKISPSGGSPQTITEVAGFQDAAWGARGDIIFRVSNRTALFRIRESGGPPEQITELDAKLTQNSHRGPVFLPGGLTFLFTSRCGQRDNNALYVGSLDSRTVKRLMPIQSEIRYIRSSNSKFGSILYYRDGGLVARRFNSETQELSGDPVPVVDDVDYNAAGLGISFGASSDGRVAILRRFGTGHTRLTWFDRQR